ncbi:alpha/beta fold hydrolase [Pseudonocardia xinjiangensis]|uniref:alpha/beta fold hydrolase n=1 Tax=Pseudonocardia xinjiangensis TaxID=75289 RepID=UPI003D920E35
MARPPRHAVAAVLACLAVLVAGCTVGPSQRPPVAVRGDNMPVVPTTDPAAPPSDQALPEPQEQRASMPFSECTQDTLETLPTPPPADRPLRVECGELTVPADPDQPGLGAASLAVLRVSLASAPENQPPLLVLGDTTLEPTARDAVLLAERVAPEVLQEYTLIGLDRRGSGEDVLDCAPDDARAAIVDADPGRSSESDLDALLEEARSVVQECNLALDGGLSGYRTAATVSDIEILRAALGVAQLSAIGVGDGGAALADWARTAPTAVGRLVLDGPPNPALDEPDLSESRAGAAEAAFGAFAVTCTARSDCPLGPDPRARVTALVDQLRRQPLAATDGRRLTAGATITALLAGLAEPRGWPGLATALAAAGTGNPDPLLTLLDPLVGPRGRFDGMLATSCNDVHRRLAPGEIGDLAQRWRTSYPLFGSTFALRLLACAPWPAGGPAPTAGQGEGAPPILVIGTAADPRGPQDGSRRTADSLATARFLGWQGAGTGAYPRTPCVTAAVDAMLVGGIAPQAGTLCPP